MADSILSIKTCTKCGETKALELFPKDPRYQGGHRTQCIKCRDEYAKQYGIDNRAKRAEQTRIRYWKKLGLEVPPKPEQKPTSKICSKCREEKPLSHFWIRNGHPKNPCKACKHLQTSAWREKNKAKVNAQARARSKSEKSLEQNRERANRWRANNPDKKRAESLRWTAKRRELRAQPSDEPEENTIEKE